MSQFIPGAVIFRTFHGRHRAVVLAVMGGRVLVAHATSNGKRSGPKVRVARGEPSWSPLRATETTYFYPDDACWTWWDGLVGTPVEGVSRPLAKTLLALVEASGPRPECPTT